MKYKIWLAQVVLVSLLLSGCSVYIAPPFTDIMKLSQIKPSMKFKQVVDVLGVEPYDIYHLQENGAMLASFNYRLKKRIMRLNTLNHDEFRRKTTNEDSQTAGDLYYEKDYKTAHVLFNKDGEMTSYITTDGVENSNLIVISGNTIQYADEKNINLLDPAFNGQVIRPKKKENKQKTERRGIFKRFFGARYQDKH
jgi:hypothetical protein